MHTRAAARLGLFCLLLLLLALWASQPPAEGSSATATETLEIATDLYFRDWAYLPLVQAP